MKRVLAIDPGTLCGWALSDAGAVHLPTSGVWDLRPRRHEGAGMRFVRLRKMLADLGPVELVVYEEVRRHLGVDAAHIYGGIVATIQAYCEQHATPYTATPVQRIKRQATGKGNAKKEQMLEAARARWGEGVTDDNHADALWLLDVALAEIAP